MPTRTAPLERRPSTQARGRARRELLIQTTKDLLDEQPLDTISLAEVAARAGIPTGSAYHFFPSLNSLFEALAERFAEELDAAISAPYEIADDAVWVDIFYQAVDRGRAIYEASPAYRQLIISGKSPAEIKLSDRVNDELGARLLIDAINQHFVLPDIPRVAEIFFYAVEIIDTFFMLSMLRNNEITNEMIIEAKRARYAYLRVYLPRELPRRVVTTI